MNENPCQEVIVVELLWLVSRKYASFFFSLSNYIEFIPGVWHFDVRFWWFRKIKLEIWRMKLCGDCVVVLRHEFSVPNDQSFLWYFLYSWLVFMSCFPFINSSLWWFDLFLSCTWWILVVELVVFWRRSSSVILDLFWSEFSLVLFLRTCLEYSLILKSLSWCVLSFNFYVSIFFFHPLFFHFTFELFKNDASWDLFCKLYLTPSLLIVSSSESIFTVYFSVQRFLFF